MHRLVTALAWAVSSTVEVCRTILWLVRWCRDTAQPGEFVDIEDRDRRQRLFGIDGD